MMAQGIRITGIALRNEGATEPSAPGRIMVSPQTATVMRALAKHSKSTIDDLVQRMLQDYIPRNHPELQMIRSMSAPKKVRKVKARMKKTP